MSRRNCVVRLNAEIAAQFDRFRATGLEMDHINGHKHFHLHPVVLVGDNQDRSRALARRRCGCRLSPSLRPSGQIAIAPLDGWPAGSSILCRLGPCGGNYAPPVIRSNDQVFGLNDSGAMVESRMLQLIDRLPDGISELYCHPAKRRWDGPDTLPPGYRAEEELGALLSPAVRTKLEARGLRPLSTVRPLPASSSTGANACSVNRLTRKNGFRCSLSNRNRGDCAKARWMRREMRKSGSTAKK